MSFLEGNVFLTATTSKGSMKPCYIAGPTNQVRLFSGTGTRELMEIAKHQILQFKGQPSKFPFHWNHTRVEQSKGATEFRSNYTASVHHNS